ncbi:hypothetical protein RHMOL_Rhmol10G0198400 [Rhododendron molle]|uniref:Uncharacterized protein n=1 Tax=Rhododendron molle TaxID=49168 RepID=A0ACC0M4C1_RHOML|nr:hypothetical protein RHMOL_Rhmol10G0198400 [Rhododendron molle]
MLFVEQEKRKSEEWSRIDSEEKDSLDANHRKKTQAMFQSVFFFSKFGFGYSIGSPFPVRSEDGQIYISIQSSGRIRRRVEGSDSDLDIAISASDPPRCHPYV